VAAAVSLGLLAQPLAQSGALMVPFLGAVVLAAVFLGRWPAVLAAVGSALAFAFFFSGEGMRCIFLKGNHEDMFLAYMGYPGHYGEAFLFNGGESTMAGYRIQGLRGRAAAERLPHDHLAFLIGLRSSVQLGDFHCVHAGVRPTRALDDQVDEDRYWIREDFILKEHPFPVTVLFGHTPQREVLMHLPYKVGLDTGLVYGNKLSCFELTTHELLQIGRGAPGR
jgi:serine/threonine protein phosphatase 1